MSLVPMSNLLKKAQKENYAVAAFNIYNIEMIRAAIEVAEELNSPVILQLFCRVFDSGYYKYLGVAAVELAKRANIPIAVHLDHGKSKEQIIKAISIGLSSVMYDGSLLDYETNIKNTQEMNEIAKMAGITFEAELGYVGKADDLETGKAEGWFTDPDEAKYFVDVTGVDCLAVMIGNAHGLYKSTPKIDFERLEKIRSKVSVPLVMHGGTGLSDEIIKKSIKSGICKINIATELNYIFYDAVKEQFKKDFMAIDAFMVYPIEELKKQMKQKISLCGSEGKA